MVQEEFAYDQHSLTTYVDNAKNKFNDDQHNAYENILNVVTNKDGKLFFVYGNGGIGKTFVPSTRAKQNCACSCLIRNYIFVVSGWQNLPFKNQDSN